MPKKKILRIRLSTALSGDQQLIRATALDHKKQMFFQAATEEQAIEGLKAALTEYEKRQLRRSKYPKTIEVKL